MYLNTKKTFSELPIGIGFGGDMGNFRLWIDKDFGIGKTRAIDITYRKGYRSSLLRHLAVIARNVH